MTQSKKGLSAGERALRIELLRAHAALERQRLGHDFRALGDALKPSSIFRRMLPKLGIGARPLGWLGQSLLVLRGYPLLASSGTRLMARMGKHSRLWRLGLGLLLGWRLARPSGSRKQR
jgi:hypothetical protein